VFDSFAVGAQIVDQPLQCIIDAEQRANPFRSTERPGAFGIVVGNHFCNHGGLSDKSGSLKLGS